MTEQSSSLNIRVEERGVKIENDKTSEMNEKLFSMIDGDSVREKLRNLVKEDVETEEKLNKSKQTLYGNATFSHFTTWTFECRACKDGSATYPISDKAYQCERCKTTHPSRETFIKMAEDVSFDMNYLSKIILEKRRDGSSCLVNSVELYKRKIETLSSMFHPANMKIVTERYFLLSQWKYLENQPEADEQIRAILEAIRRYDMTTILENRKLTKRFYVGLLVPLISVLDKEIDSEAYGVIFDIVQLLAQ